MSVEAERSKNYRLCFEKHQALRLITTLGKIIGLWFRLAVDTRGIDEP